HAGSRSATVVAVESGYAVRGVGRPSELTGSSPAFHACLGDSTRRARGLEPGTPRGRGARATGRRRSSSRSGGARAAGPRAGTDDRGPRTGRREAGTRGS